MNKLYELHDAERFVRNIDRSILGNFAVPEELLVLSDYIWKRQSDIPKDTSTNFVKAMHKHGYENSVDCMAELFYWYNIYNEDVSVRANEKISKKMELIEKVAAAPREFVSYYEMGIWDDALIKKLISEGIDSVLASAMVLA